MARKPPGEFVARLQEALLNRSGSRAAHVQWGAIHRRYRACRYLARHLARARACSAAPAGRGRTGLSRGRGTATLGSDGRLGRSLNSRVRSFCVPTLVAIRQVPVLFIGVKPLCFEARVSRRGTAREQPWLRARLGAEAGASAAKRGGDSAAGRSRRLFGPDESSSEVSNVANRYSSAIWMKRARRSAVSALRASSKQHSAMPSNCLVKVAFIARQQR